MDRGRPICDRFHRCRRSGRTKEIKEINLRWAVVKDGRCHIEPAGATYGRKSVFERLDFEFFKKGVGMSAVRAEPGNRAIEPRGSRLTYASVMRPA